MRRALQAPSGTGPTAGRSRLTCQPRMPRGREDRLGLVGRGVAVEAPRGRDRVLRERGHRPAVEAELPLEDDRVGDPRAQRATKVPQRARPDPPVRVHLAAEVLRVVEVEVDAPQAVRLGRRVRDRVPVGDAGRVGGRGAAEPRANGLGDGDGEVVAEALADRTGLVRREREALREVDGMAVLVQHHLGVLGVVDAALAEPDLVLVRRRERVVGAPLVDPHPLRLVVHRRAAASRSRATGCTAAPR